MFRDLTSSRRSRAVSALLLFCALFFLSACGGASGNDDGSAGRAGKEAGVADEPVRETAGTPAKRTTPEPDAGAAFVQRADSGNIFANSTYLDHPASNGKPDAIVFATPVRLPDSEAPDNARPIGVWYDAERERWAVYNQDRAPMPEGASFNVTISEKPTTPAGGEGAAVFVHRAASENVAANSTYIDHPLGNDNPDAFLSVTPNWNPDGGAGVYDDHPIGVWYDAERKKWAVYNQDRAPMPEGASFNVAVSEKPADAAGVTGASIHRATLENTVGDSTYVDISGGGASGAMLVTPNWNPGGGAGTYDNHPVGVRYDPGRERWAIYNLDGAPMPEGAAFNVTEYAAAGKMAGAPEKSTGEAAPKKAAREPIEGSGNLEGPPEYRDFYSQGDPGTLEKLDQAESSGNVASSAGAIPAVKPFNFGRDPGGPEDKTLYLTVPKIGLEAVPVYNSTSEEDLKKSAVHVPATGFPWQEGANTFIAGHRIGYPNTGSYYVFFNLVDLTEGDEIFLEDSAGGRYVYRVTKQSVVGPDNVESLNPVEGKSVVSLQTCTLPDYAKRIVVQGELVEKAA